MRRLFQGVSAAIGLVLVVVGVPLLLIAVAGWPLPTAMPDWSNVYWSARQQHIPAEFVVKSLAVVAWVAWAQLTWAIVWELVVNVPRTLRGVRTAAAPGSWSVTAGLARWMVAPLMLLSTLGPSTPAVASPSLAQLSSSAWFSTGSDAAATAQVVDLDARAAAAPVWVVAPGDSLWDVAERCLGDGSRVDEVLACNPGVLASRRLRPGETITLPAEADVPTDRQPQAEAPAAPATTYVVESGDTLWDIADEQLGDPLRWPEVFELNEGRTFDAGGTLTDADLIRPGWDLDLPSDEPIPAPTVAEDEVEVEPVAPEPAEVAPVIDVPAAPSWRVDAGFEAAPAAAPTDTPSEGDVRPVNEWSTPAAPRPIEPGNAPAPASAEVEDRMPALVTLPRALRVISCERVAMQTQRGTEKHRLKVYAGGAINQNRFQTATGIISEGRN